MNKRTMFMIGVVSASHECWRGERNPDQEYNLCRRHKG